MKTIGTFLISTSILMLLPWCLNSALAQENEPVSEKKIVITKRTLDPDGTETTETIVKKGQAAEKFDVEKYVEENQADNVELDVRVHDANSDDHKKVVVKRRTHKNAGWVHELENNINMAADELVFWDGQKHGFLGVRPAGDNDANVPGVPVDIVNESGAAVAGLQDGDVLLKLNDTPINNWKDITTFMKNTAPEDKVQVTYARNGQEQTAEAVLGQQKLANFDLNIDPSNFDIDINTDWDEKEKDACLGVYTSASGEGDSRGAKISKFTDESAAVEAEMATGDVITAVNGVRVKGHDQLWDEIAKYQVGDQVSVDFLRESQPRQIQATLKACRNTKVHLAPKDVEVKIRQKDACLGVYSAALTNGDAEGASITEFTQESAARDAEMQVGDVITAVNGIAVKGHSQLWDEIAKYPVGEQVNVDFLRENQPRQIQATLKACRDNSNRVRVLELDNMENELHREFFLWNWDENDGDNLRQTRIITIRRGAEGDAAQVVDPLPETPVATDRTDRNLQLEGFRAYPNPSQGQVTVEFHSEPLPTVVSLLDMTGRQLFREELNAFSGDYFQQFDLSEYAKGTIVIHILQNGKVFTEQIIVN
ncbi:MAG: PDZ domain-containing protein [Lewinellaceae bacterium]|nr:PDZ domain-containing protein [Saprospiraceae bacterium]MCB9316662.1 PDZ domain-containing protein [Lewinellaceae bacterium]MCB9332769.1 PDZ domain-containing protein [Lewinellaceae bacterium]